MMTFGGLPATGSSRSNEVARRTAEFVSFAILQNLNTPVSAAAIKLYHNKTDHFKQNKYYFPFSVHGHGPRSIPGIPQVARDCWTQTFGVLGAI